MDIFTPQKFDKRQTGIASNLQIEDQKAATILGVVGTYFLNRGSIDNLSFIDAYNLGCNIARQLNPNLTEFPVLAISSFMLILKTKIELLKDKSTDSNTLFSFLEIINKKLVPVQLSNYLKLDFFEVSDFIHRELNRDQITATVIECIHYQIFHKNFERPLNKADIKEFVENLLAALYYAKSGIIKLEGWNDVDFNLRILKLERVYKDIGLPGTLPR